MEKKFVFSGSFITNVDAEPKNLSLLLDSAIGRLTHVHDVSTRVKSVIPSIRVIQQRTIDSSNIVPKFSSITIDSGWSEGSVRLDLCTTRGQVVRLTPEMWEELKLKVDSIILNCKEKLDKR